MSEGRGVIPSIVLNYKLNYTVELSTFFDGLILYMKKKNIEICKLCTCTNIAR